MFTEQRDGRMFSEYTSIQDSIPLFIIEANQWFLKCYCPYSPISLHYETYNHTYLKMSILKPSGTILNESQYVKASFMPVPLQINKGHISLHNPGSLIKVFVVCCIDHIICLAKMC